MHKRKIVTFLLICCLILALVSCGTKTNTGPKTPASPGSSPSPGSAAEVRDTLNVSYSQDRGTLNPMYNIGYDVLNAIRLCYDSLWDFDSEGNQIWKLATGLDLEDEGRTWIIHLREGVKFSNGNPLTADDVIFTLYLANNREGEPDYFPEMDLDNTKALDDYTVSVAFHNYDMSYITSITSMLIIDKESYDETAIMTKPIGTGPYKLVDYVVNSHLKLERKDEYWGPLPSIKYINFYLYTEDAQKTNALQTGAIDVCDIPFQDIDYISSFENYSVEIGDSAQSMTRAVYFNATENSKVFYNNPDARKAVAMAIDREAIVDIVFNGYGVVSRAPVSASCVDITEDMLDYGVYSIGYNPEKAKELAIKSGLVDQTISISTNGTSQSVTIAECIQADLNAIGVKNVVINNYDSGSWLAVAFDPTACGDMLIDFTGTPSKTVAQNMQAWYLYHIGGGYTRSPFEGKERYEELIDGIMAITDRDELTRRYKELIQIHTDALLWFNICDVCSAYAHHSKLEGFRIMRMGHIDYANMYWT